VPDAGIATLAPPLAPAPSGLIARAYPEIIAALIVLVATAASCIVPPCADVSWQLWIAHHLRHGARLYGDIMEVNPPLWFWMAMPIDALAEMTGLSSWPLLIGATGLATLASLIATGRLIGHLPAPHRAALLAYAALVILIMPMTDMAQREQFALIGALPYLALVACRCEGRNVPLGLALGVGAGAAIGFALKHYFLLVPGLLELWLLAGQGRGWRPLRPETLITAAVGALYAVAILIFAPGFVTAMLPLVTLAYGGNGTSLDRLIQLPQIVWLAIIPLLLANHRLLRARTAPLTTAALIAASGFAAGWFIQHKGWLYHSIAATGCLAMALALLLAEAGGRVNRLARLAAPAMLVLPLAYGLLRGAQAESPAQRDAHAAVAGMLPGDSVAFVTSDPALAWPTTYLQGFRYPTRYYGFWMLQAIVTHEQTDHDPRFAALNRRITAEMVTDYRCAPPERILFSRPAGPGQRDLDMLAFFSRDPDFAALMRHYRPLRVAGELAVYTRISPLVPPPPGACRRGV
jgi:hypothetical protein